MLLKPVGRAEKSLIPIKRMKVKSSTTIERRPRGSKYVADTIMKYIFKVSAMASIVSLITIICFVFAKGLSPFVSGEYSLLNFVTGSQWVPSSNKFGILPMIQASVCGTAGALLLGIPVGVLSAVFIAEIAPKKVARIISSAVELLAGIPSVLYGIFALCTIVPFIQKVFNLPQGQSLLAVIMVLSIMMLPTIITVTETSLRSVPKEFKEASLALGASHIETIFKVIIPSAKSGIFTAIGLGMGRAIGETMAVILVAGNSPVLVKSLMQSVRPMTTNIALEMGYASGMQETMLFATGVILFMFILILNLVLAKISSKVGK